MSRMNVTELRALLGVSRAAFSRIYNIPLRTLESWESGERVPPSYVIDLLNRVVIEDAKSKKEKETMNKDIEILMKAGSTESEAKNHLKNGTIVFDDFEEHFEDYMSEWACDEDDIERYRKMIETKAPVEDWAVVCEDGKAYYIMYVL